MMMSELGSYNIQLAQKVSKMETCFKLLFAPGEVVEIRALGVQGKNAAWEGYAKGTIFGYFDNPKAFAKAAAALEKAKARGIYFTLNPVNPDLLARAVNRLKVP